LFELHDAIAPLPGATAARELVVKRALEFLDKLTRHAGNDVTLRRELATAYHRLGTLQGTGGVSNLGNSAAAVESFQKAARLGEENVAATGSIPDRRWLARFYDELSNLLPPKEGDEYARKALEVRKTMAARLPETEAAQELAYSDYSLANRAMRRGDFAAALEGFRKALAGWETAAKAAPAGRVGDSSMGVRSMNNIALAHKRIAAMLALLKKPNEALEHYRAAESIEEALLKMDSRDAKLRLDATFTQSDIGTMLWELGDRSAAIARYRKVLTVREELAAADPKDARVQWALASTYGHLGGSLWKMGDRDGSLSSYRRALAVRQAMLAAGQEPIRAEMGIVYTCYLLGSAYRQLAEEAGAPATRRIHLWRTARDFFARANQSVIRLKPQRELGELSSWNSAGIYGDDARQAARIVAELPGQLQTCDVAIARSRGE
jgi:non-specific serine/threonine protein kinase/serine/threonine-protein kinase